MSSSLADVPPGGSATVIPGGLLHDETALTTRRLIHQGIVAGTAVTIIRRTAGGGRVVGVGRSRIALDPSVARGILVELAGDDHTD